MEFTDTSTYKNFRMANLYNFTMAAMGPQGALFAAKSGEGYLPAIRKRLRACLLTYICNNPTHHRRHISFPANMMFRPFNSWASNSEWSIKMPVDEEIEGACLSATLTFICGSGFSNSDMSTSRIAAPPHTQAITVGGSWCAVATNAGALRILSTGGIQLSILALPGPVVAMAAHENLLAVAYHLTPPTRGTTTPSIRAPYRPPFPTPINPAADFTSAEQTDKTSRSSCWT